MKRILFAMLWLLAFISHAQEPAERWALWENKEVSTLSNDNTGAQFALGHDVKTTDGLPTLQVMPSGTADETKLALTVSGADLQGWSTHSQVTLEVYVPEGNTSTPNAFFMGMADVSAQWAWIDGVFGAANIAAGWNTVMFAPSAAMRGFDTDGRYTLYFAFFRQDSSGKPPLTEPFYLGHAYLGAPDGGLDAQRKLYQAAVADLLALDDDALLDAVARATFDFFWYEANPDTGLIKDRSTPSSAASIASVGFGLAAIPIGIERGWISRDEGYARALTTLQTFANGGVEGTHGFFFHFVDAQTGRRAWGSELSSIDSTLFIAGALTAAQYFAETEVAQLAHQLYAQMDWQWMMNGRGMVSMGWKPESGFLDATWDHFDESILLYVLAIGSPTHPAPLSMWDAMRRPVNREGAYIYLPSEPLFVYQYPLAFLNLRGKEDKFANYFNNTTRACERNRQFSLDRADSFTTYQHGVWGLSASDGPRGYRAYGAEDGNHDGTIAPYASTACVPFTRDAALESMRAMLREYGVQVWGKYGFVSAFNADVDWYSVDYIGIDQGVILLMLANAQDGIVWDLFMQNPQVQQTLEAIGFVESQGDYAVTPAYLESRR